MCTWKFSTKNGLKTQKIETQNKCKQYIGILHLGTRAAGTLAFGILHLGTRAAGTLFVFDTFIKIFCNIGDIISRSDSGINFTNFDIVT